MSYGLEADRNLQRKSFIVDASILYDNVSTFHARQKIRNGIKLERVLPTLQLSNRSKSYLQSELLMMKQ